MHEEIKQILQLYINCNHEEQENIDDIEECTQKLLAVFKKEKQRK